MQQAEETRDSLKNEKIDLILCPLLKRDVQTAEIVNQGRKIPMIIDERVLERDFWDRNYQSVLYYLSRSFHLIQYTCVPFLFTTQYYLYYREINIKSLKTEVIRWRMYY